MAYFDLATQLSSAQAITSTAASTNLYDVTGAGTGVAPAMIGANGVNTAIGFDIGSGDGMAIPYLYVVVTTAFVSGGGATLTIQLQAAPDNGSYSPGTYTTLCETQAFIAAQLVAGATIRLPVPPLAPGEALPRFYRVNYVVVTSTFSAGAVTADILLNPPEGQVGTLYGSNFTV